MSEKNLVHIFRCPGAYEAEGVRYSVKSHAEGEDLPDGWFKTLAEAAKAAGKASLIPEKKNTPKKIKMMGMPSVAPKEEESLTVEKDDENKVDESEGDKNNEVLEQKDDEVESKEVSKEEDSAPKKVLDDGENFKRYEELSDTEKHEIKVCLATDGVDEKELRETYNIHHLTLKKLKEEV